MGPMGPKTLCNACGVRYRKEVETEQLRKDELAQQHLTLESA